MHVGMHSMGTCTQLQTKDLAITKVLQEYQVTSGIAIQFGDGLWALHHLASFNLQKGGA